MIKSRQCPKCGGRRIAGPHRIFGQHHVRIDLPGMSTATLEAITCADCGYTELYADRLEPEFVQKQSSVLNAEIACKRSFHPRIVISSLSIRWALNSANKTTSCTYKSCQASKYDICSASIVALRHSCRWRATLLSHRHHDFHFPLLIPTFITNL